MISAQSYSTGRQLSDEERAQWEREAEARRAKIREDALRMIGRDANGKPFPPPDAAEEERLETADLREPLREAQAARHQIALSGDDQKDALRRAQAHLEGAHAELRQLEERAAAGERAAAARLADSFRGSETPADELTAGGWFPATSEIDAAKIAVHRAQNAVATLACEVEATQRELVAAQHQVGLCVLDCVKAEILRIGADVATHDRAAAQGRANLEQAGYVTANLQHRHNWPARIFTTSTLAAMRPAPAENHRPPAASIDWQDFINRLHDDAEAEPLNRATRGDRLFESQARRGRE
jgi:hypothetical protein